MVLGLIRKFKIGGAFLGFHQQAGVLGDLKQTRILNRLEYPPF